MSFGDKALVFELAEEGVPLSVRERVIDVKAASRWSVTSHTTVRVAIVVDDSVQ